MIHNKMIKILNWARRYKEYFNKQQPIALNRLKVKNIV